MKREPSSEAEPAGNGAGEGAQDVGHSQVTREEVTRWLLAWRGGESEALARLMPLVYGHLHMQARRYMSRERSDHTLQPTALVHEAFLRLVDQKRVAWRDRHHFYAVAATSMRRVLLNHARALRTEKRGGGVVDLVFDEGLSLSAARSEELIALDEALTRLAEVDRRQSRIVELRFFAGLTLDETAQVLDVSSVTVKRDWRMARAWLQREIRQGGQDDA